MACIPPILERWVYIKPLHGPLDGPLYTWAQYTPTLTSLLSLSQASLLVAPSLSVVPHNNVAFKWTTLDCIFASSQPPASAIRVWFQYLTYLLLLLIDKSFFTTNFCSAFPKNLTTVRAIRNTNFQDHTCIVFALFLVCTFWLYIFSSAAASIFIVCYMLESFYYLLLNHIIFTGSNTSWEWLTYWAVSSIRDFIYIVLYNVWCSIPCRFLILVHGVHLESWLPNNDWNCNSV